MDQGCIRGLLMLMSGLYSFFSVLRTFESVEPDCKILKITVRFTFLYNVKHLFCSIQTLVRCISNAHVSTFTNTYT